MSKRCKRQPTPPPQGDTLVSALADICLFLARKRAARQAPHAPADAPAQHKST